MALLAIAGTAQQNAAAADRPGYLLGDGSIQIVTPRSMTEIVRAFSAQFQATHPGTTFTVREGDNYSSMSTLTFDRSLVGPLGGEYTRIGLGNNLKIAAEPLGFRIAHASVRPGNAVPALGIIIHASNPLATLSLAQLTRIFCSGGSAGDIATWSQAGVGGPLGARAIHTYGPEASDYLDSDDPQAGEFLSGKFGGLVMNHNYLPLARYSDVVERVREDPSAIGIVALNVPLAGVRVLPLKAVDTGIAIAPTADNIVSGRYPLDRFVYLYVRVGKASAPDPLALEFVRQALTAEGQSAISSGAAGYLPLNAGELAQERARLDR